MNYISLIFIFLPHCSNHHNKHLIPYGSTSWLNHARKKTEELVMSTHTCFQNTKNITLMSEVLKYVQLYLDANV